jgi:thioredoxin 1
MGALFAFSLNTSARQKDEDTENAVEKEALPVEASAEQASLIMNVSDEEDFRNRVLSSERPCMVDFYSDRCPPCRMLSPVVEKLAGAYRGRITVFKVNVDTAGGLARRYGIRGVPSVLFFRNGEEVERISGLRPEAVYEETLNSLVSK